MLRKIFLFSLVVILFSCMSAFAQNKAVADTTIKIGYIGELSGPRAPYGTAELNMLKLAVDDANKAGGLLGKEVKIVALDTKGNDQEAVKAVRQLVLKDNVCAVIGTDSSSTNIATAPFINTAKVPQIATRATHPLVTVDTNGKLRPYSFRMCFTDDYQGKLAAILAFDILHFNKNRAAILFNTASIYSEALRSYFSSNYRAKGGEIVAYEKYSSGDTDFRNQLTIIKKANPKVLFIPGTGREIGLIIRQARAMKIYAPIISGDGYSAFINTIAGSAIENSYWINHAYTEDPAVQNLLARYELVYGRDVNGIFTTILAYDAGNLLFDAIKRAGSTDGTAIAKALENTKNLKLVHAGITIDPTTHNPLNKPGIVLKIGSDRHPYLYKKITNY